MPQPTTLHWYPWFAGDWRRSEDVRAMTMEQRGLYRELLDEQWETGSLPASPAIIARLVGASPKEWARCWPAVAGKFSPRPDGRLVNPRLAAIRETQHDRYRVFHARAAKAADARWGDANGSPSSNPSRTASGSATGILEAGQISDLDPDVPPPTPPPAEGRRTTRAERNAALRGLGPSRGTWRDACQHQPPCQNPTTCELAQLRERQEAHPS